MRNGGYPITDFERALLPDYAPRPQRAALGVAFDDSPVNCVHINHEWLPHLIGVISALDEPDAWVGTASEIDYTRSEVRRLIEKLMKGKCVVIGSIHPYAGKLEDLPEWALPCDGSGYNRVDYPDLYAVLEATFIVDSDNFLTPDMRNRFPVGTGTRAAGVTGGQETVILSIDEIPAHTHTEGIALTTVINGGVEAPANAAIPSTSSTGSAGGGLPHENMPPFLAVNYYIIARYP